MLSFNEAVLYRRSGMYCIWKFGGIIFLQFMCLVGICIQIHLYKKSQPKAESQLISNSVVFFHIKRRWDTVMFVLRRWGKPKGSALPILLLQENGRSGGVTMVPASCCKHEVEALIRICLLGCWFRTQQDFGSYFWWSLPQGSCLFCLLEQPNVASIMLEVQ